MDSEAKIVLGVLKHTVPEHGIECMVGSESKLAFYVDFQPDLLGR
jgi:hypothetical protein